MTIPSTYQELISYLRAELAVVSEDIPIHFPADVPLNKNLGVASLHAVEFATRVQYKFGLNIHDREWNSLITLNDIARFTLDKLENPR